MDKYNKKTAFQKWFSAINLNKYSKEAQMTIKKFDYYHKKAEKMKVSPNKRQGKSKVAIFNENQAVKF